MPAVLPRTRSLLLAGAACVALLGGLNALLSWRGPGHFLPHQRMQASVAAGSGCLLLLGDSRMNAAHDAAALHAALGARGADRCIVDLAIGATDMSGLYLTLREYLARGGRPRLAVIGKVADSLLGPDPRLDPQEMFGNNAIHLVWSRPSDVFLEVPGFPFDDVAAFDAGLRFLVARGSALGRFQSLFSLKVQHAQDALVGADPAAGQRNRWGLLGDMGRLEQGMRARAPERLAAALAAPPTGGERLGRWFPRVVELLRVHGIPFAVVELPMRQAFLRAVAAAPPVAAYQRWLAAELPALGGGVMIDLGAPAWLDDRHFRDALHMTTEGAALFSRDLGDRLATLGLVR